MPKLKYLLSELLLSATFMFAQQSGQFSLAVNDLSAQGMKESEAVVISEQLCAELMKSPRIRLIERSLMQEILKEQGFQQSGCTSDACAVEVGQLLGVKNIVVGSVGLAGSYTVLSVRIIDVSNGSIIVNESIRTKGGIDKVLEAAIPEAAEKLCAGLFPAEERTAVQISEKRLRSPRKLIFIGAGTAVLVGSGIAAAELLKKDEPFEQTTTPNTRIELP